MKDGLRGREKIKGERTRLGNEEWVGRDASKPVSLFFLAVSAAR